MSATNHLSTLRDCLRHAVSAFGAAGVFCGHGFPGHFEEAAYLVMHTLHLPHDRLETFLDAHLSGPEIDAVLGLIDRRVRERLPAAYLTHEAWVADCRFYVDQRVIVPRSFVGSLLPDALSPWTGDADEVLDALDLCTGSGCLAILLALAYLNARVVGSDLSDDALAVARRNVRDYALEGHVELVRSDLFAQLPPQRFDLIVSNPPYVDAAAMANLPLEYRAEPGMALASGGDGLDHVRQILGAAAARLKDEGVLVVEVGHQRHVLEQAFPGLPFVWLDTPQGGDYVFLLRRADLPAA